MPSRPTTACDTDRLRLLLTDQLPDRLLSEVTEHVANCSECQQALESIAADAGWWSEVESFLRSHEAVAARFGPDSSVPDEEFGADDPFSSDFVVDFLEPCDQPEAIGRLGEYEIVAVIGRGGMGVVLKGFQRELGRFVAVKVMTPHLAASGAARQRFVREARAAAAIVHPHVMPIHSVCTTSRLPYLVMPFVACESLQERIDQRGQLEVPEILRISLQTAQALAASHAQGLVHRDVKPANILLETGVDRVLLTDFGLARAADDVTLTRTGVVSGTPLYMSPEQSRGESIDPRSDLFSLGSVMYAMCAGRPPFRAETAVAVLRMISDTQACSLREINPQIPDWLEQIIARLLEKSSDRRFQSAGELVTLLEQCLAHVQQPTVNRLPLESRTPLESTAKPPTPVRKRFTNSTRTRMAIVASLCMAALVFILMISRPRESQRAFQSLIDRTTVRSPAQSSSSSITSSPDTAHNAAAQNAETAPSRRSPTSVPDPAPFSINDLPVEVSWNFQGESPNFVASWGTRRAGSIEPLADGMKLSRRPMADESEFAVGFEVSGDLSNDFEITLDYRDFQSQAVSTDWRVPRIDISGQVFSAHDPVQPVHVLGIAHRRAMDSSRCVTAMQGDKGPSGTLIWRSSELPVTRDSGRLRLIRQGSSMFYQTAPFGTEKWTTVSCRPIDVGLFKLVVLGLRAEDLEGSGAVILTKLTIRAAEFQLR
jgi:serine/threonine protein kinase